MTPQKILCVPRHHYLNCKSILGTVGRPIGVAQLSQVVKSAMLKVDSQLTRFVEACQRRNAAKLLSLHPEVPIPPLLQRTQQGLRTGAPQPKPKFKQRPLGATRTWSFAEHSADPPSDHVISWKGRLAAKGLTNLSISSHDYLAKRQKIGQPVPCCTNQCTKIPLQFQAFIPSTRRK